VMLNGRKQLETRKKRTWKIIIVMTPIYCHFVDKASPLKNYCPAHSPNMWIYHMHMSMSWTLPFRMARKCLSGINVHITLTLLDLPWPLHAHTPHLQSSNPSIISPISHHFWWCPLYCLLPLLRRGAK
jgi:hypothetical protein